MKKYILLNLSALFALFLAACMFISCGKSKKSKPSEEGRRQPKPSPFANPFSNNPFARAHKESQITGCRQNLLTIKAAIIQFGFDKSDDQEVTMDDIVKYMNHPQKCPSGGEYEVTTVDEDPTCTIEGHTLHKENMEEEEERER